jgi:fructose-bisphosphate aldolase, class II
MRSLREVLGEAAGKGVAIGHFNVADLSMLKGVLAAAAELRVPVLVGASEGERDFFGTRQLAVLVKSLRDEAESPVFLNADHTHSLAKAVEAAKAGFDAIVVDFSASSFEENVRQTREAVHALRGINPAILVEGEIGDIGTGSEIHQETAAPARILSTPEEAKQFVAATSVDVLAPAVGNMHGLFARMVRGEAQKHLDIERIGQIKKATSGLLLTLHGGSGTADEDLRRAIGAGINIVHINTELRLAWRHGLEAGLSRQPSEVVPYKILPAAIDAVRKVALSRLQLFNGLPRPRA